MERETVKTVDREDCGSDGRCLLADRRHEGSAPPLPQAAPGGIPRPPASRAQPPTPSPDRMPSASAPRLDEPREQKEEESRPDPCGGWSPMPRSDRSSSSSSRSLSELP